MSVITITVAGQDITDSVIFSSATFESQLSATPGMFEFTVRDDEQVFDFSTGDEVTMSIDGTRHFGGFAMQVVRQLAVPVDDTSDVASVRTRQWTLRGVDYNILFDKRVVYNKDDEVAGIPPFPTTDTDEDVLERLFSDYLDVPPGLDTTTYVTAVGDPTPTGSEGLYVNPGDSWRKQMETLSFMTGALWYIDPNKKLHYQSIESESVSWSFADKPNRTTTFGFREMEFVDDATNVVNDALVWGGSPFGSTGVSAQTVFGREENTTSQAQVGRWQYAEKHFGEQGYFEESGCEARARVIVRGDPTAGTAGVDIHGNARGLQLPQKSVRLVWHSGQVPSQLPVGTLVNVFLYVYGPPPTQLVLPVRSVKISFPVPDAARFDAYLGIQTQDPWSLWKYLKKATQTPPTVVNQQITTSDGSGGTAVPGTAVCVTPTGNINGSNTLFSVPFGYVSGSLQVWLNGLIQRPGSTLEYVETSPSDGTFTFNAAPLPDDELWACYSASGSIVSGAGAEVGFGAQVTGGDAYPEVHVTNLNDTGAGSFRAAAEGGGNRKIVFDVQGTINLSSDYVTLGSSNVTVAGETAPGNGIVFEGYPLFVRNAANNVIIRHIRHDGDLSLEGTGEGDCITIGGPSTYATNVLVHHCSFRNWTDEAVAIWGANNSDVTVALNIFGPSSSAHNYGSLAGGTGVSGAKRITWYANLFYGLEYRQPAVGWNDSGSGYAPEIVGDVVNNLIWKYTGYGTSVYYGGKANVINNYYYTEDSPGGNQAVELSQADQGANAYLSGNYSKDGSTFPTVTIGDAVVETSPFSVPSYAVITPMTAAAAAAYILSAAGCRVGGLDASDQAIIADIEATGL